MLQNCRSFLPVLRSPYLNGDTSFMISRSNVLAACARIDYIEPARHGQRCAGGSRREKGCHGQCLPWDRVRVSKETHELIEGAKAQ